MEILDCTSTSAVDFDLDSDSTQRPSPIPKGLGSIPDSIHVHPTASKPNVIWKTALSITIIFFQTMTWSLQFFNWILETIFGSCAQKALYRELHQVALKGNKEEINQFLREHAGKPFPAGYLFSEFMELPELHNHLPEILKGANVCLDGDGGLFCKRWSEHPECYKRFSSHDYQKDECFAIGHILFWIDPEGNTRFQFENSPYAGLLSSIDHILDYLRYRRDNEQQGVTGTSPHTEDFCLRIYRSYSHGFYTPRGVYHMTSSGRLHEESLDAPHS